MTSTNRTTTTSAAAATRASRFMPPLSYSSECLDSRHQCAREARAGLLEERRVRPTRDVAPILAIPVRQEHHDDLQSIELSRADEWIVVPRPAMFVEEHPHRPIFELEPRLGEGAIDGDERP